MADIFDVVADATRRDILRVLLDSTAQGRAGSGESSVSEIVGALGLSQPTVSKHLKVLREAGLVAVREEGQRRYYRLNPTPLAAVEDWLAPFAAGLEATSDAEAAGLREETREFAGAVGKAFAEASHRVGGVVGKMRGKGA